MIATCLFPNPSNILQWQNGVILEEPIFRHLLAADKTMLLPEFFFPYFFPLYSFIQSCSWSSFMQYICYITVLVYVFINARHHVQKTLLPSLWLFIYLFFGLMVYFLIAWQSGVHGVCQDLGVWQGARTELDHGHDSGSVTTWWFKGCEFKPQYCRIASAGSLNSTFKPFYSTRTRAS